ncbi:hypothetical protein SPRG_02026 [Saprolegnia parasitica CBS 223.65]|uniref:FYVE-type domain-containing protein n=1 Tax=Saprolegnia parasitica (strain CBS 223.65) TaxID=695850 RepID=A0A067D3D1_SAPPC|nr:hypothetical protein SPRG_02026 [Saprolegnia parasitica CBS 223.65]KDO33216.1 hypothetical protein SPRG_02026 [Saprolegnia parasitica CBS 223.65]|eukprot:XP_012195973.1 hypothetical protein SPRG_02026 [Saprolegnia parasitica CBS 223.65]
MRVLGLPKKLFGDSSPAVPGPRSTSPASPLRLVMPAIPPVAAATFPSPDQRAQLQTMGKQSCTSLKRLAFSMATVRESWERLETDNNMEMFYLKDTDDHDGTMHVCGIARVHAPMTDFAAAMQLPLSKAYGASTCSGPPSLADDDLLACESLVSVDDKSSIQWLAMKSTEGMLHRDFVVLQRSDTFTDGDGVRGHIVSMHSMDFPGAPPQFDHVGVMTPPKAYRFVRGGMYRSGFVILEDARRKGVLDVFALFKVDFKGDKQLKHVRATLVQWFRFLGDLNQYYLSAKLHAKGAPRIRQPPASSAKSKARRCESCAQPFKFQLQFRAPVRDQCLMCGAIICGACKIDFRAKENDVVQVFCIPCLDKWNPDSTTSIKLIQPTNLPGQTSSPVLASITPEPAADTNKAPHNLLGLGAEPVLRSEMENPPPVPRRRSVGQDNKDNKDDWPAVRYERSCSVPDPVHKPTSIAAMETVHLDSLDYRVSLYGRFSISTASQADLEARLEWITASCHAMDSTVTQLTRDGKLRRAMQVMQEKKTLRDEAIQVQAALDAMHETSGDSLEAQISRLQAALSEVVLDGASSDLRAKRERLLRRASLKAELKAAQDALQKKTVANRREQNGSLLFNPEIFVLDGQLDVLRGELHHCVMLISAAQKRGDAEAVTMLTSQRLEIKESMATIQDQLVQLGAPSVGNRSSIAGRRSTIVLVDDKSKSSHDQEPTPPPEVPRRPDIVVLDDAMMLEDDKAQDEAEYIQGEDEDAQDKVKDAQDNDNNDDASHACDIETTASRSSCPIPSTTQRRHRHKECTSRVWSSTMTMTTMTTTRPHTSSKRTNSTTVSWTCRKQRRQATRVRTKPVRVASRSAQATRATTTTTRTRSCSRTAAFGCIHSPTASSTWPTARSTLRASKPLLCSRPKCA